MRKSKKVIEMKSYSFKWSADLHKKVKKICQKDGISIRTFLKNIVEEKVKSLIVK